MPRRLRYADVTSTLAVFLALGGVSYAATQLPRNSVGTTQIRTGAVRSAEVKNRSLRAVDFARGQVPAGPRGPGGSAGKDGAPGSMGAPGSAGAVGTTGRSGPTGSTGPAGPDGALGYTVAFSDQPFPIGATTASFSLGCGAGNVPLGGGASVPADLDVITSIPLQNGLWAINVITRNGAATTAARNVRIEITCARRS